MRCHTQPPLTQRSPPVSPPVVATMRDLGRRGELETRAGTALGHTLEIRQLDVDCEESVRRCVEAIPQRRVDVLGEG